MTLDGDWCAWYVGVSEDVLVLVSVVGKSESDGVVVDVDHGHSIGVLAEVEVVREGAWTEGLANVERVVFGHLVLDSVSM